VKILCRLSLSEDLHGRGQIPLIEVDVYFHGDSAQRLKKVKVRLKKHLREISKIANKMAEVHGNRTHMGGYQPHTGFEVNNLK
jgi:hypothetical protein